MLYLISALINKLGRCGKDRASCLVQIILCIAVLSVAAVAAAVASGRNAAVEAGIRETYEELPEYEELLQREVVFNINMNLLPHEETISKAAPGSMIGQGVEDSTWSVIGKENLFPEVSGTFYSEHADRTDNIGREGSAGGIQGEDRADDTHKEDNAGGNHKENEANETGKPLLDIIGARLVISGSSGNNEISVTFDDGFDRASVRRVLDVLKSKNIKCTFFIIGKHLRDYGDLWLEAVKEGMEICNHTQSHRFLNKLTDEEIIEEITGWEKTAAEILGQDYVERMKKNFPFLRCPGGAGHGDERVMRLINSQGYIPVGWSIETHYEVLRHHNLSSEPVLQVAAHVNSHITGSVRDGSIVLLHFIPYDTVLLEEAFSIIIDKGIKIVTVSELLN